MDLKKFPIFLFLLLWPSYPSAFEIVGNKWPGGQTDYYVGIDGISATGINWQTAFLDALQDWNNETIFNFSVIEENRDPCIDDGLNSVDFTADVCGSAFGSSTLAVTLRKFELQALGPAKVVEADVVVNQDMDFDIFDGNLVQFGQNFAGVDFRRVALHELGHVIGLDHEPVASAIMRANIGNTDRLQADDINGVNTLYSGLSNCTIQPAVIGRSSGSLRSGDCTVQELTVGGGDTSFIDVYEINLASTLTIDLEMTSAGLDSVLLLADENLEYIDFDSKSSNSCDSTLIETLQPGKYFILANTFDVPPKVDCGNTGNYELLLQITSASQFNLGAPQSLLGSSSGATFSGGITRNNGFSWGNAFNSDDSLDIVATINVDPVHVGQPGFLVVGALLEDQILLLNEEGNFVDFSNGTGDIVRAANKLLASIENIEIAEDLVPVDLGIDSISVDFVVGYGLDSAPNELYYHGTPINLTVSP